MDRVYEDKLTRIYDAMCAYESGVPQRIHHFVKVHSFARQIVAHEDMTARERFVLEAAALMHDIGIKPAIEQTGACPGPLQERLGPPIAKAMLASLEVWDDLADRICFLIGHHHTTSDVDGLDWQILLEADFLVNMIESHCTQEGINAMKKNVFRTEEGLRLIEWIRPAAEC